MSIPLRPYRRLSDFIGGPCAPHNASEITNVSNRREYQRFSCGAVDRRAYLAAAFESVCYSDHVRVLACCNTRTASQPHPNSAVYYRYPKMLPGTRDNGVQQCIRVRVEYLNRTHFSSSRGRAVVRACGFVRRGTRRAASYDIRTAKIAYTGPHGRTSRV
ncbi:hypothetical protein GY45DRAFT_747673 [Cubamyces sp. BRFM 1775]|nr:hypothetical protein GY45DRAFT_747673 [Cubamyces sp. BRFM 1775]